MRKKLVLALIIISFGTLKMYAQWECPSRIGSGLKPLGTSNLSWANELTTTGGVLGNYSIANLMDFVGLDYTNGHHTLYFEGGTKFWYRNNDSLPSSNEASSNQLFMLGVREGFYRFLSEKNNFTLGIHSAKSDDYYLLNERIVGANYAYRSNGLNINVIAGSVVKPFARNGTFCTLGYLYNVIPGRDRAILGRKLGQTNLGMITLSYKPEEHKSKQSSSSSNSSEFSSSEFSTEFSSDSSATNKSKSLFPLYNIGLVAYGEFGDWIQNEPIIGGAFAEFGISDIVRFKPEVLYQASNNNNAIIYSITAEKQLDWGTQMSKLFARYVGVYSIDSLAKAQNSFSNVFAGEVIRMDALELPFLQAGIKHSFSKIKTSIKLQGALQTADGSLSHEDIVMGKKGKRMSEYDVVISKNFGKYVLVNLTGGYLDYYYKSLNTDKDVITYQTNKDHLFGKVELRLTF